MNKSSLSSEELAAAELALTAFVQGRKASENFSNEKNSISYHLSSGRPFIEAIVGDALLKLDQILASDLAEAGKDGQKIVSLQGLLFECLPDEHSGGAQTKMAFALLSDNGMPVCQMRWREETPSGRVDFTISECPDDDPMYPFAPRIASAVIHRVGSKFGPGARAFANLACLRKLVAVMDHLREPLKTALQNVDLGPEYLNLGISRHELETTTVRPLIDMDGGLPGALCRRIGKWMLDTCYADCFDAAGPVALTLIAEMKAQRIFYGDSCFVHNDLDDYLTLAVSEDTGEDAIVASSNGYTSLISITVCDKGKPTAIAAYHAPSEEWPDDLIEKWMSGHRDFAVPCAHYDYETGRLELPDSFVENHGGEMLGLGLSYAVEAITKQDAFGAHVSDHFDYMRGLMSSEYGQALDYGL